MFRTIVKHLDLLHCVLNAFKLFGILIWLSSAGYEVKLIESRYLGLLELFARELPDLQFWDLFGRLENFFYF